MIFGFTVYSDAIGQSRSKNGEIPFPCEEDTVSGGHAVMAVGYDDKIEIANSAGEKTTTVGALQIRNSWSEEWGDQGYGWLPYEYVLKGLAMDWWTVLSKEWVDTHEFGF